MGNDCCGAGPQKMLSQKDVARGVSLTKNPSEDGRKSLAFLPNNEGRHYTEMYAVQKKEIGSGSFGAVRIGENKKTKQLVAIKTIDKLKCKDPKTHMLTLQNEIDLNKAMDHPNIARMYETFEDRQMIYIAMELCSGGEMFDLIIDMGHFSENHACVLMKQIFRAVFYMHDHCVAHRDLKPENFLIKEKKVIDGHSKVDENTQVKVIDFGIAKRFVKGTSDMKTKAGTAYYIAPELLGKSHGAPVRYNEKCDVWSCGVILYILLCGSPPFGGEEDAEIFKAVKLGRIAFDYDEFRGCSSEVKQLIKNCCTLDVSKRYNSEQAANCNWCTGKFSSSQDALLGANLISKFKNFGSASRFQKAARHIIAHHLDEDVLKKLQDQFMSMDKDNNGELSLEELKAGCAELGILETKDIAELFESIDADHSGTISYSEFLAATIDSKQFMRREVYWEAFRVFDLDQNGRITKDEFNQIMKNDGADFNLPSGIGNAKEIAAMFQEADADGDGEIDFEEFCAMMNK